MLKTMYVPHVDTEICIPDTLHEAVLLKWSIEYATDIIKFWDYMLWKAHQDVREIKGRSINKIELITAVSAKVYICTNNLRFVFTTEGKDIKGIVIEDTNPLGLEFKDS